MLIKYQHFYLQGCTAIKYKNEFYLMKLSATATLHHKSFCLDKIEKNLHQNHVFLRKGPGLYLKKIKSTKHQRREKMQLLKRPFPVSKWFRNFFSKADSLMDQHSSRGAVLSRGCFGGNSCQTSAHVRML